MAIKPQHPYGHFHLPPPHTAPACLTTFTHRLWRHSGAKLVQVTKVEHLHGRSHLAPRPQLVKLFEHCRWTVKRAAGGDS